jgi:Cu/Zn superoxide dismutase
MAAGMACDIGAEGMPEGATGAAEARAMHASAQLVNQSGGACGAVTFLQTDAGLWATAFVRGIQSGAGPAGFHVHAVGVCQGDFTSNGPHHFNANGSEPLLPGLQLGGVPGAVQGAAQGWVASGSLVDLPAQGITGIRGLSVVVHNPDNPKIRQCCGLIQ